jgi:hypothetical protein
MKDPEDGAKILRKQMNCAFRLIYKSSPDEDIFGITLPGTGAGSAVL